MVKIAATADIPALTWEESDQLAELGVRRLDARGRGYLATDLYEVDPELYAAYYKAIQQGFVPETNHPVLSIEDLEAYFTNLRLKLSRRDTTGQRMTQLYMLAKFPAAFWTEKNMSTLEETYWNLMATDSSPLMETWKGYVQKLFADIGKGFQPALGRFELIYQLLLNYPGPLPTNILGLLTPTESTGIVEPGDEKGLMPTLVSGKWAGMELARRAGVAVPDGFVLPIRGMATPQNLRAGIEGIERRTGKKFGESDDPLLVSVRSGAVVSFPGEMKSVTNVGITPAVYEALKSRYGEEAAADMKLRFIHTFAEAVWGITREEFAKQETHKTCVENLTMAEAYLRVLFGDGRLGAGIPEDPYEQLRMARNAVFKSSVDFISSERITRYGLPGGLYSPFLTAVVVNEMKFGNLRDGQSGSGVAYSRHRRDGSPFMMVDYRPASQGEDVVSKSERRPSRQWKLSPRLRRELEEKITLLEKAKKGSVEVEFVVESGKIFITQVKDMEAPPEVKMRIAEDMEREGLIVKGEASQRILHLPTSIVTTKETSLQQEPLAISAMTNGLMRHVVLATADASHMMEAGMLFVGDTYEKVRESIRPSDAALVKMGVGRHDFNALSKQGVAVHITDDFQWQDNGMLRIGKNLLKPGDRLTLMPNGEIHRGHLDLETVSLHEAAHRVRTRSAKSQAAHVSSVSRFRAPILVARRSAALHAIVR